MSTTVVFAGLVGAIAWNLATWWLGLPSSSSHALIGGVVGAAFAADGADAVNGDGLVEKVLVPGVVAPLLAFAVAALSIVIVYEIVGRLRPGPVNRGYRLGQLVSASLFSLAHGTNDAQKTMGIITLALIAHGDLPSTGFDVPDVGHRLLGGGDRARHLHGRLADHPHDGQPDHQDGPGAGLRRPVLGRGGDPHRLAPRLPAVDDARHLRRCHGRRRGQAPVGRALGRGRATSRVAWVLTLPAAALIGAVVYGVSSLFGNGAAGPLLITLAMIGAVVAVFVRRLQERLVPAEA